MYAFLLSLHSLVRWAVLLSLLFSLFKAYQGKKNLLPFTPKDNSLRHITETICHIQLILGLWLYFISPLIDYFFTNIKEAVHHREIRFFGMEHITVMLIAISVITIGSAKAKRKNTDAEKWKTIWVWYGIGLLLILISIPWSFSPLISRPLFRGF